jgi:SAM-dependent methyltransferase
LSAPPHAAPERTGPLWRLHSDRVNRRLIERWLAGRSGAVLKTDLYDEYRTQGLFPALTEQFDRVCGIDIDPEVVAGSAERHPGLEALVADVRSLPFADSSFDAVVSNSTLDHFDGPAPVASSLAEIRRVLRPGGALVVTMDNPRNPLIALRNRLPSDAAEALRNGFPYPSGWTTDAAGLRAMLESAGLAVIETTAVCHAPRALLALARRPVDPSWRRLAAAVRLEALERLPTRTLTGHFVAALAVRPAGSRDPAPTPRPRAPRARS